MDSIETLTAVLGWCTVINFGVLIFASVFLMAMGDTASRIHGRMFGLGDADLKRTYFQYLAYYKIAIFMLNLSPYIALKIIT